nr:M14 family metallopeptidase [Bacteroidales bacterium]
DGQQLVSEWYMRNSDTLKRSFSQLPRLYQKYAGHDNNRDFYMMNLKETRNMARQLYVDWMPQIIYNHHQSGPAGSVVAGPPYRDPFNHVFHPLVITGIDAVGAAMINRMNAEGKPGYTQRGGSVFSTWYNGGLRTTTYFHNMIGLLTEIIGSPTPSSVPLVPNRLVPNGNTPYPVMPQKWNFKKSIDYSVSLNYAVLDYAARNREHLLYNIYLMGRSSIEAGSRDNWTAYPGRIDMMRVAYEKDRGSRADGQQAGARPGQGSVPMKYYEAVFSDKSLRDPRGYIIPSDQPDFTTAVRFINALIRAGIKVSKATEAFTVEGVKYPEGSYIVKTNQAFRPHVLDMFEAQDHPNDFQYPGGPPVPPYDMAGWTPAFTMGVKFTRMLDDFSGPFEALPFGELQAVAGKFNAAAAPAGYILDSRSVNSFIAVNDLLRAGAEVYRISGGNAAEKSYGAGSFFIPSGQKAKGVLQKCSAELGVNVAEAAKRPAELTPRLNPARIAIWDTYGGSMDAGWLRWIMEEHRFDYKVIYAREIDKGNLRKKYDVVIFVSGAIPSPSAGGQGFQRDTTGMRNIPAQYREQLGRISADTSVMQIRKFMESGGTVLTIGRSTNLAYHLKMPVTDALTELKDGKQEPLPSEKYYIPGSVLRVRVDSTLSSAWGMGSNADLIFESSPVFRISPSAVNSGLLKPVAWFETDSPLRSGWAWGQQYLKDGVAAFEAEVGKGKLLAFGPEITFRAQTYSTFRLIFNQLYVAN